MFRKTSGELLFFDPNCGVYEVSCEVSFFFTQWALAHPYEGQVLFVDDDDDDEQAEISTITETGFYYLRPA